MSLRRAPMALPQERYSREAMRAFADSRQFMALVCTACQPRNLTTAQLTAADLLLPAQDSFYGFPVFKRHYWRDMSVFAMSLFLGKPAILVEHHEFFRDGTNGVETFVRQLAELHPGLKWHSLMETVTRTHTRRRLCSDKWEVRFFTDTFQLEHEQKEMTNYRLIRRIPEATNVKHVHVDGREVPFSRQNGFLAFETRIEQTQTVLVQVDVAPVKPTNSYVPGLTYQASVAFRRGLCEFRDNIVCRSPVALRAARRMMKILGQTAG